MLTGMTGPTSGTATVYGQDILTEMETIRKGIAEVVIQKADGGQIGV